MKYKYSTDEWEEVLKNLGYSLSEERVGFQNTINCIIYKKDGNSRNSITEFKIYFDRKTNNLVTIHTNNWNFNLNNFISDNTNVFREVKLKILLGEKY